MVAETDPYWGVISAEDFRGQTLDKENLERFFAGGERFVSQLFATIGHHFRAPFQPKRSLDFGCGVGRLLIPIAKRSEEAVGVDIAPRMIELCGHHLEQAEITNTSIVVSDDYLERVPGLFDFINTYIVMQHIPPKRGNVIIQSMLDHLEPGGTISLQMTFAKARVFFKHEEGKARYYRRDDDRITDLMPSRDRAPEGSITMFDYDLNSVFAMVNSCCGAPVIVLPTRDDNHLGVHIIARKAR